MTRAITFIPGARAQPPQDLHYFDHGARNRSVHALFQDTGSPRGASRQHFVQKAYGELVSRFGARGRIEHPLPFLRDLARAFEGLSRRVDCRVDDFDGVGVYVLIRDGDRFYALVSRGGSVLVDSGGGFGPLASLGVELPLDTSRAQQELFSQSMRDALALYRVDTPAPEVPGGGPDVVLRVLMGGAGDDVHSVADTLDEPGAVEVAPDDTAGNAPIAQTVIAVSFPASRPARDPVLDALRAGQTPRPPRMRRIMTGLATTVAFVALAGAWMATHRGEPAADMAATGAAPSTADTAVPRDETVAAQEASARLEEAPAPPPETAHEAKEVAMNDPATEAGPAPVRMSVDWRRTYPKPVTTTPAIDGDRVIFGSRDGHVYALDRRGGDPVWSYEAGGGVGSSPVVVGGAVVGADYSGRVFSLDRRSGKPLWTRKLPDRVVSTPCPAGGEVLVGCTDGVAYGLSLETGRVLWQVRTKERIRASAAAANGAFFVPSYDGKLYAISQGSGAVRWAHPVGGPLRSSPAADETRVVIGGARAIHALDVATGGSLWHAPTHASVDSYIGMAGGRVFAGCADGRVYCLDAATGKRLWTASTGKAVLSRPCVAGEVVFVTSYDNSVYCFNATTGERVDRLTTTGAIYSSPVTSGDRVFFGNNEGEFYCINYRTAGPE